MPRKGHPLVRRLFAQTVTANAPKPLPTSFQNPANGRWVSAYEVRRTVLELSESVMHGSVFEAATD